MTAALDAVSFSDLWGGLAVGLFGGLISGLLGVSPGGALVPGFALVLSLDQHRAQALSLMAQLLPTGVPGVIAYHRRGHRVSIAWAALLSVGFLAGAYGGALGAGRLDEQVLQWMFAGYLLVMAATLLLKRNRDEGAGEHGAASGSGSIGAELTIGRAAVLMCIGVVAGITSGLLGIGGGLAMTVLMIACLSVPQHQAQAVSLAVTVLPTGLPAIWVYIEDGRTIPWWVLAGAVTGLLGGAWIGARIATRLNERRLRYWFLGLILLMATLMVSKALR